MAVAIVGNELVVETAPVFKPLQRRTRYRGCSGGRGSGKSHFFAEDIILDMAQSHTRVVCAREILKSIGDSSKQLLEDKIRVLGLEKFFRVAEREIICPRTDSVAIFRGLQSHTASSIKSIEAYNRLWVDEAQSLSNHSLEITTPTFRANGSIMDFSWNPVDAKTPVERMFRENGSDPDFTWVHCNYHQNRWFPADLRRDMERDKRRDPDKYAHVWLGRYRTRSEARVFHNWSVEDFPDPPPKTRFYFGADWGYSIDPTVLVRCWINGTKLMVDHEAYAVGCEIDNTPALFDKIPGARFWPCTADNARPETIAYMRRHGFPKIRESIKGKGSVEDGIEFLKSLDIVVHPRCKHTVDELATYAWKIDPRTDEILPVLGEKSNHVIDALRYALEGTRRSTYTLSSVS